MPVIHKKDKSTGKVIDKIACSEYWKGKDSYRKLQDSFYRYVTDRGFALERGKQIGVEHLSTEKLKEITEYENIKYEIKNNSINEIETQNTNLILSQNKQLIEYANRLRRYYIKSVKTIEKCDSLKNENIKLKYENEKLKKENKKLKDYIENTFEVVKYLFNFPVDRLRRLVKNFIKSK